MQRMKNSYAAGRTEHRKKGDTIEFDKRSQKLLLTNPTRYGKIRQQKQKITNFRTTGQGNPGKKEGIEEENHEIIGYCTES